MADRVGAAASGALGAGAGGRRGGCGRSGASPDSGSSTTPAPATVPAHGTGTGTSTAGAGGVRPAWTPSRGADGNGYCTGAGRRSAIGGAAGDQAGPVPRGRAADASAAAGGR